MGGHGGSSEKETSTALLLLSPLFQKLNKRRGEDKNFSINQRKSGIIEGEIKGNLVFGESNEGEIW
jgi:hypothetical protein